MIMKIIKNNRLMLKFFKMIEYKKITNDDISEDREEYFDVYKTIIQISIKINAK